MAEFVERFSSLKSSRPCDEIDRNLDLMSQFEQLNGSFPESFNLGLSGFSNDNFLPFLENLAGDSSVECQKPIIDPCQVTPAGEQGRGDRKRRMEALSEANSINSSATTTEAKKNNRYSGSGKRGRSSSKDQVEDQKEVVHVRARRGQATDSHSLAERVRREKINERMRCLQELVPGCYKTMGMAGALDEIINYVQSLQNQVEFLSMKLSAASSCYDFSSDMEAITTQQVLPRDGDAYLQAEAMERLVREQGYGECTSFQSPMPF